MRFINVKITYGLQQTTSKQLPNNFQITSNQNNQQKTKTTTKKQKTNMVLYINKISMVDMGTTVLTTKNQKKKYRKGLDYSDKKKWAKGQRIRDKDRKNARHNKYLENNLYAGREYITVKRTNHEKDTPFDYDRVKKEDEQEKAELVYELDQYVELYDYYDTIEEDKMKHEQPQDEWWDEEETKRSRKLKRQEVEKSKRKTIKIDIIMSHKNKYRKGLNNSDKKKWAKGQRIRDKDRKNARYNKYLENNLYAGREYITVKGTIHEKDTSFDDDRVKKEEEQEKAELMYGLKPYVERWDFYEYYDYYDKIEEDKMKNEQQQQEWWDEEETKRNRKRKRQEVEKLERKKIKIETIVPQINNIYCKHLGWHQTCDFINKVQSSPKKIYNGFDDEIFIPDAEEWMFGK